MKARSLPLAVALVGAIALFTRDGIVGLEVGAVQQPAGAITLEHALATVERFSKSLDGGDRTTVLDCLAPEVVIFEHGGAELSREEYASHHLDGDLKYLAETEVRVVDRKILSGADRAIVLTRTETSGQFKGKPVAARGTETLVLERRGDHWLIVHVHWSSRQSYREAA